MSQKIYPIRKELGLISYEWGKTTNFIIYNWTSYDKILSLENFYKDAGKGVYNKGAFDVKFCQLGLRHVTHIPYFSYQEAGYSDIEQRFSDARKMFERDANFLSDVSGISIPKISPKPFLATREKRKRTSVDGGRTFRASLGTRRNHRRI